MTPETTAAVPLRPPRKEWIQTYGGKKFFPLDPRIEDIEIRDIGHALSNVCRFTGHVARFYSVAEHSWRVGLRVLDLTGDHRLALAGLLHDASEAYIADVSRPLKQLPAFESYRAAEKKLQALIYERFGLEPVEPDVVKQADNELLAVEANVLMAPLHPEWAATTSTGRLDVPSALAYLVESKALGYEPRAIETLFGMRFEQWRALAGLAP